jgi:hypothetical protein
MFLARAEVVSEELNFIHVYFQYFQEIWWTLAIGFLISGLFFKFVPSNLVERHLGKKGLKPILYSSFIGTLLPVCCIGSLPIAITLRRKGATLGAVLAFMVATPATSISALIVCWKLLGFVFTAYIFVVIILMSIIMGITINAVIGSSDRSLEHPQKSCCSSDMDHSGKSKISTFSKLKDAVYYALIVLPKEIGVEILIGIALASFITVFEPIQLFIHNYLAGYIGYAFVLIVGLLTYVCSTASVPMADAFIHSGMSYGQALCYLLVGPITSYGTILVIKKDFGSKVLGIYLIIICVLSLISGIIYDYFF